MDIDVNTATRNELLRYAHSLGLDAPNTMSKEEVRQLVASQTSQQVSQDAQPDKGAVVTKNLRDLRKQKRVRIRIHENPAHPPRIAVNVNGVRFTIKPGVWVDVPEAVVEVLRNARATYITQIEDERGVARNVTRDGLQFPFEVAHAGMAT